MNKDNLCADDKEEMLLSEDEHRLVLYPIRHHDIWNMYKKQQAAFWTAEEIDFSRDYSHWIKLTDNEQHFIKYVLAFFAASDGIVNLNLLERFTNEVKVLEAQVAYTWQAMIENIHSEVYSLMIDTYIKEPKEKKTLLNAIQHIPCITEKADWTMKWIKSSASFATRLVAFAIVEGIFFSGSFCAIYWLKERNLLPGLTLSNEFIARDEGMHCDFACLLYSKLKNKLSENKIHQIVKEAVNIEIKFITESLPCNLIGMNSTLMIEYIKFVADRLVKQLQYKPIYKVTNPFQFMDTIGMESKSNFFENRVSQYQKPNVLSGTSEFKITDDF